MSKEHCYEYPRPAVCMDVLLFCWDGEKIKILLIKRKHPPMQGMWAFPGGFLEMNETCEEGAKRELKEETDVDITAIFQFHAFSEVDRDPRYRNISVSFFTLLPFYKVKATAGSDAEDTSFFDIHQMPEMAFDHQHIFETGLNKLKEQLQLHDIGYLWSESSILESSELEKLSEILFQNSEERERFVLKHKRIHES